MTGVWINHYYIKKIEELNRKDIINNHMYFCVISTISMLAGMVFIIISGSYDMIMPLSVALWLGSIAYIDKISGYVFCVMEYYSIIPVVITIIKMYITVNDQKKLAYGLIADAVYIVILKILSKRGMFGEGDADILSVLSIIIMSFYIEYDVIIINVFFFSVASFIFFLRNIKSINLKILRLKKTLPFVPGIFYAYLIYYFTFLVK